MQNANYSWVQEYDNHSNFWVKVLSTAYETLFRTSWQEAMKDICVGRLEVIEVHPSLTIGTVKGPVPMPSIVRFNNGVFLGTIKKPQKTLSPTRKNIFLRDMSRCQYCKKKLTLETSSIDHVIPRSRGGKNVWENVVLSCVPCNTKKGNKTLDEIGFQLAINPKYPADHHNFDPM